MMYLTERRNCTTNKAHLLKYYVKSVKLSSTNTEWKTKVNLWKILLQNGKSIKNNRDGFSSRCNELCLRGNNNEHNMIIAINCPVHKDTQRGGYAKSKIKAI